MKIEHTLFSLPMIYSGMALGYFALKNTEATLPSSSVLFKIGLLVLVAATGARTTGFAMNRIVDRHIDARNPRTAIRDLPTGRMTLTQAYSVLTVGVCLYLLAASQINSFCFLLSPIPLVVFGVYPFLKRFTILAHFGVGLSLALGPLGGYFAVNPTIDARVIPVACLFFFTWCWVSGFDIIYSTTDEEFDKKEGLFSFPARFGKRQALRYSAIIHVLAFLLLAGVYLTAFAGSVIVACLLVLSGYLLYLEQAKADDVELAFFKINAVLGFVVFAFVFIGVRISQP
ncbi:MAG TPA: 4-hydroxybenzoate octaprenyltransferase [Candidatus Kapabacteria bacterium]|nr:4-hydroxybenzoate octaprenyltransferase [Candidatus Kapabacteria bacterium]